MNQKHPATMTPVEYAKAIEWIEIDSLPDDAQHCHSFTGKEDMYYSRSTGMHYTVYGEIIRRSRTVEEIGFEPYRQEIHIKQYTDMITPKEALGA